MSEEFVEQNKQQPAPEADPEAPKMENFDDYDRFVDAKIRYQTNKATEELRQEQAAKAKQASDEALKLLKSSIKDGVKEAVTPPGPPIPLKDDERWKARKDAQDWQREFTEKAMRAQQNRDYSEMHANLERAQYKWRDLAQAGPTQAEKDLADYDFAVHHRAISQLGEANLDSSPFWNDPKAAHDSMVEVHRFNQNPRAPYLLLPVFDEESGRMGEIRPSSMRYVELPPETLKNIQRNIYSYRRPEDSDTTVFKKLWDALKASGYLSSAKPTYFYPSPEPPESEKKKRKSPDEMSQAEFEIWRKSQGGRRF